MKAGINTEFIDFTGDNQKHIQEELNKLILYLSPDSPIDYFRVLRHDGRTITIVASSDFTYYHNVEIMFRDVYYFRGDTSWRRDELFPVIVIEDAYSDSTLGVDHRLKFAFNTEDVHYHSEKRDVVVWAKGFAFNTDTVLYYPKANLNDGERLADWIAPK